VDPGCFATLKMESGLVASVTAGNSLSGASTIRLYGTKANAVCSDTIEVTFFGEVSSVGQLVGEPFVEVWEEDHSDGLNTCERCVREMVAHLDGDAPFPYDGVSIVDGGGVHACEILLDVMASSEKDGQFVDLPLGPGDHDATAKWA
jgi:hypothetical protein